MLSEELTWMVEIRLGWWKLKMVWSNLVDGEENPKDARIWRNDTQTGTRKVTSHKLR